MPPESHLTLIAKTIQLSVAPVFLLTAIGTMLNVLTSRFNRIVDRSRVLEEHAASLLSKESDKISGELSTLARRSKLIDAAITVSTISALLICSMIAAMFIGVFLSIDLTDLVALLFVSAVLAFIGALLAFLREILIAANALRIGMK